MHNVNFFCFSTIKKNVAIWGYSLATGCDKGLDSLSLLHQLAFISYIVCFYACVSGAFVQVSPHILSLGAKDTELVCNLQSITDLMA